LHASIYLHKFMRVPPQGEMETGKVEYAILLPNKTGHELTSM